MKCDAVLLNRFFRSFDIWIPKEIEDLDRKRSRMLLVHALQFGHMGKGVPRYSVLFDAGVHHLNSFLHHNAYNPLLR